MKQTRTTFLQKAGYAAPYIRNEILEDGTCIFGKDARTNWKKVNGIRRCDMEKNINLMKSVRTVERPESYFKI